MSRAPSPPQSFSWGQSYAYETEIRSRVLAERTKWFIRIRWWMLGLIVLATAVTAARLVPGLDWRFFGAVALLLGVTNTLYHRAAGRAARSRGLLLAQVLTDYLALAILSYATGPVGSPILVLFVAHVILSSLFFDRRTSLLLAALAPVFAVMPMVLVATTEPGDAGLGLWRAVPSEVSSACLWFAVLGGCFLFCWYLTSTITASLKLRERQLEESNEMLENLDKEKTKATLRATHELKAPFAAIKSYVYSLQEGYCGDLPPKALDAIKRIGDRCDRLTTMITAIIHLSNLRSLVVSEADLEPVDLAAFMPAELDEAEQLGSPRGITIRREVPAAGNLLIRGAPRHLHTLVSNLLRNAISYSDDGGEIEVSLHPSKKSVVLRVIDHGIGITREAIPSIFDDFFRSNAAARKNPQGNGLGLAMVKEIARLHGATIEVASEEGKGTSFWVWFRRASPPMEGQTDG